MLSTETRPGKQGRLLPIRIEEFTPRGLFGPRNCLNLFDLDKDTACKRLLDWIGRVGKQRFKPKQEPASLDFSNTQRSDIPSPNPEPTFPGRMPPIFGLPARNCNFTGRETLLGELRNQLAAGKSAALTAATRQVATHGLGGVGKSQLAIEYAWRWGADYSRIIWLQAETSGYYPPRFRRVARPLIWSYSSRNNSAELAAVIEAVHQHLRENPGWLLNLQRSRTAIGRARRAARGRSGHLHLTVHRLGQVRCPSAGGGLGAGRSRAVSAPEQLLKYEKDTHASAVRPLNWRKS